jgi:hypothetical protein
MSYSYNKVWVHVVLTWEESNENKYTVPRSTENFKTSVFEMWGCVVWYIITTYETMWCHTSKDYNIVMRMSDYWWVLDWRSDLLTTLTNDSWLQIIIVSSLISALHRSLQHILNLSSLLCLHQSFPGYGFKQWGFFSFHSQLAACRLSNAATKSSLHIRSYNSPTTLMILKICLGYNISAWAV